MAEVPPKQSINVEAIAAELHELWATGRQVAPLSERFSAFDLPTAYEIAEEIRRRRSSWREGRWPKNWLYQFQNVAGLQRQSPDLGLHL